MAKEMSIDAVVSGSFSDTGWHLRKNKEQHCSVKQRATGGQRAPDAATRTNRKARAVSTWFNTQRKM